MTTTVETTKSTNPAHPAQIVLESYTVDIDPETEIIDRAALRDTLPTLERIRILLGLPRPAFLRLIGAMPGRTTMLRFPDHRIDPIFIDRARELEQAYYMWKTRITEQVAATDGFGMTIEDFAALLRISPYTIWKDVRLSLLPPLATVHLGSRPVHRITPAVLAAIFAHAETVLTRTYANGWPQRSPLTLAVIRALSTPAQDSSADRSVDT